MDIHIVLSAEQVIALNTQFISIDRYAQRIIETRADSIIEQIVKDYADSLIGVTATEQAEISKATAGKIIVDAKKLPTLLKGIIVRRAPTKTMVEKIAEQALAETPLAK